MMIDRATKLTVVLEAQQWDAVLNVLAEGPYRVTAPLIAAIKQQCVQQGEGVPQTPTRIYGNGDARDVTHE